MPKVFDTDIVETSVTLGTATYTLLGPAPNYRSFDQGFDTADTPYYVVRNASDTKYEMNRGGVFNSGSNTLTRAVYKSSNSDAPISWVGGDHPLVVYQPSATEILELIVQGFRSAAMNPWMQFGIWWRSDFPTAGIDTMMYRDPTAGDTPLMRWQSGSAYPLNKPPGEYVDVAYAVTPGAEPAGTLICEGGAISRTTFSKLFAVIGTTHGVGDGSTTFNKPDARGRNRIGRNNQGGVDAGVIDAGYYGAGFNTNGGKGGAKGHTGGVGVTGSASVSGGISGSTFGGLLGGYAGGTVGDADGASGNAFISTNVTISSGGSLGVTGSFSGSGSVGGATSAFTIMQPGIIADTLITTGGQ